MVKRQARHTTGSVRYDKRRGTWNYLWYDGPVRRSKRLGTKQDFPTKAAAWAAVEKTEPAKVEQTGDTVASIVASYERERMPTHYETARVYRSFLKCHVLPRWGATLIQDVQPRPVELWLKELPLAPKSKTHVRSLMHSVVEYAMWAGKLKLGRNPMALVQNKGAGQKVRQPRSLTAEQFQALLSELREPFVTISLVSLCLGLRIGEALALRWSDVDWLGSTVQVQRGIVNQRVGEVKTAGSRRRLELSAEVLALLTDWRRQSQFREPSDWVFASPYKVGRLPWSYTAVLTNVKRAAKAAGLGVVSTHAMRHTFRSWLDAVGAKVTVQQRMMRHSDIRTTMNVYGDVVTNEESAAASGVAGMAFFAHTGAQAERAPTLKLVVICGGRGRNRTTNLSIKSRMLCQLSYASVMPFWRGKLFALRLVRCAL